MPTTRNSTLYDKLWVKKYLGDARDVGGRAYPIPFQHTVVSGETGGASAGVQDKVNLCVLPANCMVVGFEFMCDALEISAGVNNTLEIGDSGDTDRYLLATEYNVASTLRIAILNTALNYKPTADVTVIGTWKTGNPKVGAIFKGVFWVIPGV